MAPITIVRADEVSLPSHTASELINTMHACVCVPLASNSPEDGSKNERIDQSEV